MSQLKVVVGGRTYHLGRIPSIPDRRNYAIEGLYDMTHPPRTKSWQPGSVLDQGGTPSCTGHAARGWELSAPVADPQRPDDLSVPSSPAVAVWQRAQEIEFDHVDPNDGATIHGIAKALHEAGGPLSGVGGRARMRSYVWARSMNGALYYLSYRGPLVIGIAWYNSMFTPSADGMVTVDARSGLAGGHAVLPYAVDMENQRVRVRNSWGTSWGVSGDFYLSFADFKGLCFDDAGEVCAGIEQNVEPSA